MTIRRIIESVCEALGLVSQAMVMGGWVMATYQHALTVPLLTALLATFVIGDTLGITGTWLRHRREWNEVIDALDELQEDFDRLQAAYLKLKEG